MGLMGTLAKVALGYAAARGVDHLSRNQGLGGMLGGAQVPSGAAKARQNPTTEALGQMPGMEQMRGMMAQMRESGAQSMTQAQDMFAKMVGAGGGAGMNLQEMMGNMMGGGQSADAKGSGLLSGAGGAGLAGLLSMAGGAAAAQGKGVGAMLDQVCPDHPVCLYRVDHHAAIVNSAALHAAGVTSASSDPKGGRFGRGLDGELDGLLVDDAIAMVTRHIPDETDEELTRIYTDNAMMLREVGITSAHMAWTSVRAARHARALDARDALPIRTMCMVDCRDPELASLLEEGPWRGDRARLSVACIKFFADGAMGSRGALMESPYLDGTRGFAVTSAEELAARIPSLMADGWQVAVHAIGDLGGKHVLDAYELAGEQARRLTRPRLEHAQIVREEDFDRYQDLGVIASMQPIHYYSDAPWAAKVIDEDQLSRLYCWRSLDERTTLAAGSDFPIDDPNPWRGIATFMRRLHAGDKPDVPRGKVHPEQAISRQAALAAYTQGAAYAAHWEDRLGKLEVGFEADVIALDRDPFEVDAEQMWGMQVLHTFAGFDEVSWQL